MGGVLNALLISSLFPQVWGQALSHVANPLTPIVHFWTTPQTHPLSLAHKQCIGVCPIALESAVFKELHHLCSMGIGHSQQELHSVKEAIKSCMH